MSKQTSSEFFGFNPEDLPKPKRSAKFTGFISKNKKEAECEALRLRLQGQTAYVQNGLSGQYEVVAGQEPTEIRQLTAEFKEVGSGVWQAKNPGWDNGSHWSLYSAGEDGSILISRMGDSEDMRELTSDLTVASSLKGRAKAATVLKHIGERLSYVDNNGDIVEGKIISIDHHSGCYEVRNAVTMNTDYIGIREAASEDKSGFDHEQDDDYAFIQASRGEEGLDHLEDDDLTLQYTASDDGDDEDGSDYETTASATDDEQYADGGDSEYSNAYNDQYQEQPREYSFDDDLEAALDGLDDELYPKHEDDEGEELHKFLDIDREIQELIDQHVDMLGDEE